MDAAPFRQFLSSKVYASKEDLSEAVGRDKGADEFCTWVLDLRFEWRSRRSSDDSGDEVDGPPKRPAKKAKDSTPLNMFHAKVGQAKGKKAPPKKK